MPKLIKTAQMGQTYLSGVGLAMIIMIVAPMIGHPLDKEVGILKSVSSMPFVFGFLSAIQLYKWSSQAHKITFQLLGTSPKIKSIAIGIICVFSFLFFFIPLSHILDFLVVRSKTADGETMGWKSMASSSRNVNFFNLSIFISYAVLALLLVPRVSVNIATMIGLINTGAFIAAMIFGCKVVGEINQNLVDSIKALKERTGTTSLTSTLA